MSITVITFTLGTSETYYTSETITFEFLKKFLNKIVPELQVKICSDYNSMWLDVEGQIWAVKQDGWSLEPCHEKCLDWKIVEEYV